METIVQLLPFLIGWFSLNLPAGCALYWLVNTTLTTVQQVYIKGLFLPKLEAAYEPNPPHKPLNPEPRPNPTLIPTA